MLDEVEDSVGVAAFVVVPGDELDEVVGEGNSSVGIEDGRPGVGHEVRADNEVLRVSEDAGHLTVSGGLDCGLDVGVLGALLEHDSEVDHGHVGSGDTEGHAGELAVERGDDLADGLCGTGGGGDDVHSNGTSSTSPVLERRTIDGGLGGSGGVHGSHETLLDAEVLVDDLRERSKAVGGAGSVGDDLNVRLVVLVVHAHHEHRSVVGRRSRDNHLLRSSHKVLRRLGLGKELSCNKRAFKILLMGDKVGFKEVLYR